MAKQISKLSDLEPDRRNANKGTVRGRGMVEKSLREVGAGRSIVADKEGRIILCAHRIPIARQGAKAAFRVRLPLLAALGACIGWAFGAGDLAARRRSAGVRAVDLGHAMREEFLSADGASFICMNPIAVFVAMALQTIGYAVGDIEAQFGMIRPRFDMMGLEHTASRSAFLASVIVPNDDGITPPSVLATLHSYVAFARPFRWATLIVRLGVAFCHRLIVGRASLVGRDPTLSTLGNLLSSGGVAISALAAAIDLGRTFRHPSFTAARACFLHRLSPFQYDSERLSGMIVP